MTGVVGPKRPELVSKILEELKRHHDGVWINKLARILKEPRATVHKYVTVSKDGYPGEKIQIVRKLPDELGGHIMIRLKKSQDNYNKMR